jgi:hypothetical protein
MFRQFVCSCDVALAPSISTDECNNIYVDTIDPSDYLHANSL